MSRWAAQTSRDRVSAPSRPSPPLYPHFNRPSGFWPCVKSCLVGGSDKYSARSSPPLYPHFNRPSGFWPCVKSCLVGGSDKYSARSWRAFFCVLWWGALDRLWLRAARFGRVCSTTGYITSGLRGLSPQALTLFGGVGFIARRPEKGNADGVRGIFGTAYRVGLRPCDRTHLKNGLVPYSYVGGT